MDTSSSSADSLNESKDSEMLFTTSNKGKPQLIYQNYIFKYNKTTAIKRYWVCVELGCGVYIHTSLSNELLYISG